MKRLLVICALLCAAMPRPAGARPVRPPEVVRSQAAPRAQVLAKLGARTSRRGLAIAHRAVTELGPPRILVNRDVDDALRLLRRGGPFSTTFTAFADPTFPEAARPARVSRREIGG